MVYWCFQGFFAKFLKAASKRDTETSRPYPLSIWPCFCDPCFRHISCKLSMTHRVLKSHRIKMIIIFVIMRIMYPLGITTMGFVATHALGHMYGSCAHWAHDVDDMGTCCTSRSKVWYVLCLHVLKWWSDAYWFCCYSCVL